MFDTDMKDVAWRWCSKMIFRKHSKVVGSRGFKGRYPSDRVVSGYQLLRVVLMPHVFPAKGNNA